MELQLPSLPYLLTFLLFLLVLLRNKGFSKSKTGASLPPGPAKLPLIGSLHHLVGGLPHRRLYELASRYGPVMFLKVGQVDMAVFSSREGVEEVVKIQDVNFASRPLLHFGNIVAYGCDSIGFSPYGGYWLQLRKICAMELLSPGRVKSMGSIREEECLNLMREIADTAAGTPVDISFKTLELNNNIFSRAAFGKRCESQQRFMWAITEGMQLLSGMNIADFYPKSKLVRFLCRRRFARLEAVHRNLDSIFDEIIREHYEKREKRKANPSNDPKAKEEDLIDVLLRVKDNKDLDYPIKLDTVKAVILETFLGGTETSATVLEWAMSELILNPRVMEKAQKEVREALKGKSKVEEKDLGGLMYLRLVIKETLRIHTPGPLLMPRVCKETAQVLGYRIPAGSQVIINAWSLARDPKYWDNPESFVPERFDGSPIDYKGTNFEYLPFGSGRRACPAQAFGLASVDIALAQLLFHFDWELPNGMKPEDLDMTEKGGASAVREKHLNLCATPRIPMPAA